MRNRIPSRPYPYRPVRDSAREIQPFVMLALGTLENREIARSKDRRTARLISYTLVVRQSRVESGPGSSVAMKIARRVESRDSFHPSLHRASTRPPRDSLLTHAHVMCIPPAMSLVHSCVPSFSRCFSNVLPFTAYGCPVENSDYENIIRVSGLSHALCAFA